MLFTRGLPDSVHVPAFKIVTEVALYLVGPLLASMAVCGRWPALKSYLQRVSARPAVHAALEAEGLLRG